MKVDNLLEAGPLVEALGRLPGIEDSLISEDGARLILCAYDGDDDGGAHLALDAYIPLPLAAEIIEAARNILRRRLSELGVELSA